MMKGPDAGVQLWELTVSLGAGRLGAGGTATELGGAHGVSSLGPGRAYFGSWRVALGRRQQAVTGGGLDVLGSQQLTVGASQ